MKENIREIYLETERLILRNLNSEDVTQDYADWLNDPEFSKDLNCAGQFHTTEICRDYVTSYKSRKDAALIGLFLKSDNAHIGNITFSHIDWQKKEIAVGISVGRPSCVGKGFAKESLTGIIDYCQRSLGVSRLYATINARNKKSLNLFTGRGFRIEKTIAGGPDGQDSYLVSMVKMG